MFNKKSIVALVLSLGAVFLTSQAFSEPKPEAPQVATDVRVSDAYVRVPVPGRNMTAAFFTLNNTSSTAVSLVAVHVDFAGRSEIHSHTHIDGMMRMRKEESVDIPAGQTLKFAPGGHHVMLFDVQGNIQTGDQLQLRLEFADGKQLPVVATVRSAFDQAHH